MKKFLIAALTWANLKFDKDALESAEEGNINLSEETFTALEEKFENAKGLEDKASKADELKTELDAAKSELEAKETELADAKKDLDAKAEELTKANADLEAANARVKELEEAAGIDGTGTGKKKEEQKTNADADIINPDAAHNKFIQETLAKAGM